jgi:hypothetical protein
MVCWQTIAVADTGIDFDHCMVWQEPFPFPCFDPDEWSIAGLEACPATTYAAMLANPDFVDFVEMMHVTGGGHPLLSWGRAGGASAVHPSMDQQFTAAERKASGYQFDLGEMLPLLKAWRDVRPGLLEVIKDDRMCTDCGGVTRWANGVEVFFPRATYSYDRTDLSTLNVKKELGKNYTKLTSLMFEKCFCYLSTPSAATIDPLNEVQGPVPPIRELVNLSVTPFSAVVRKGQGLPALDPVMLEDVCNITKGAGRWKRMDFTRDGDGIINDMCKIYPYTWAGLNVTWDTCRFEWDPRNLETAIAKCVAAAKCVYPQLSLASPPIWSSSFPLPLSLSLSLSLSVSLSYTCTHTSCLRALYHVHTSRVFCHR